MTLIKICGLSAVEDAQLCTHVGADFIGLVFYSASPRAVSIEQAQVISQILKPVEASKARPKLVGLFVNAPDEEIARVLQAVPLDFLQLHGQETPQDVARIKDRFGVPVIKALPVAQEDDLKSVPAFDAVADWLLFDARYEDAVAPGGHGRVFDWALLKNVRTRRPYMLAGGLNADNVKAALDALKPQAVDVSSGVESRRGVKSADKIVEFVACVRESV